MTLSDSIDKMLSLQGVGWLKRRAISIGTISVYLKHYKDDGGIEHIDIDQTITGGIPTSSEIRILDWAPREKEDATFGHIIGKSRRVKVAELDVEFLKNGWTEDTVEYGVVQSYVDSNTPKSGTTWIANQVSLRSREVFPRLLLTLAGAVDLGLSNSQWRAALRSTCEVHRSWCRGYRTSPRVRLL
jgi:hypothetical protein